MKRFLVSARRCESGSAAIEYAFIAGVMAVALVAGASDIGINISAIMDLVADAFSSETMDASSSETTESFVDADPGPRLQAD